MKNNSAQRQPSYGRHIGLGQNPTDQVAAQVLGCGFTQVPVIEYVTWTVELPVPDAAIPGTFGDEIDVLQNPKAVPGVTTVDSSFVINGLLQVDMIVVGFGVHVFGEPQQGTAIGNYINPTPAAGSVPVSPDAFTSNDVANGALGLGGSAITPALMEWGGPAQNALWHLVNAYQFQWVMQQRYLLINELAADVAYFGSYAEAVAAGTSQEAVQRFARRTNDKYQSQGTPGSFVPINAQRIGSVSTAPLAPAGVNVGLFHPTRAYDEMDVTWGGLRAQGGAACCTPFRKLAKPVYLEKGIPIGMRLNVQDEFHQSEMQRYLSQSDNQGGVIAQIAFASASGGVTAAGASAFLELTLDSAPLTVHQVVQTDRVLFKGGAMQIAILIKGFEVWGPWKQYITQNLVPSGVVNQPGAAGTTGMPAFAA